MGRPSPWRPGFFSREAFLDQILQGEVYLARLGEEVVGTITLQWSDDPLWRDALPDGGYVHKLAVRRAYAGRGVGVGVLDWATRQSSQAGKKFLRLDWLADNPTTREYFEKAGFTYIADVNPLG